MFLLGANSESQQVKLDWQLHVASELVSHPKDFFICFFFLREVCCSSSKLSLKQPWFQKCMARE